MFSFSALQAVFHHMVLVYLNPGEEKLTIVKHYVCTQPKLSHKIIQLKLHPESISVVLEKITNQKIQGVIQQEFVITLGLHRI